MSLAEAFARLDGRLPELPMLNEELFLLGRPPSWPLPRSTNDPAKEEVFDKGAKNDPVSPSSASSFFSVSSMLA